MSGLQLEAAWQNTWCQSGPPITMSLFNSTIASVPPEWKAAGIKKRPGSCGILLHIPLASGCCESSILPSSSNGINSLISTPLSSNADVMQEMPSIANGATYCHLTSNSPDSLFSLNELYLRANSMCISSHFQCTRKGTLQFYPDEDCNGIPEVWNLNLSETEGSLLAPRNTSNISTSLIGSVKANFVVIQDAANSVIWTTFYPPYLNAPDPTHYSYYLALAFYSLAVLGTIQIGLLYSYRFYKGRTVFMLGYMLSQFFWLIWICLDAYLLFAIIPDFNVSHMLDTARDCLLGICTLLSVFITANILLILTQNYSSKNQVICMVLLFCLQLCLSGSLYLSPILPKTSANLLWRKLIPAWVFFFYFFDLSPPIYVFFKSYQLYPKNRRSNHSYTLFRKYARFVGILLLLQFLNAFWYLIMFYIANFTTILGNDKYLLAMDGAFAFSYVFHSLVACILNHHMRAMLTLATQVQQETHSDESSGRSSSIHSDATIPVYDNRKRSCYNEDYDEEAKYFDEYLERKHDSYGSNFSIPEPVHNVKSNYYGFKSSIAKIEYGSDSSYYRTTSTNYVSLETDGSIDTIASKSLTISDKKSLPDKPFEVFEKSSVANSSHNQRGFQGFCSYPIQKNVCKRRGDVEVCSSSHSLRLKHVPLIPLPCQDFALAKSPYSALFNATIERSISPYDENSMM